MVRLLWRVLKASGMWVEHWLQQDVEAEFHNTKLIIVGLRLTTFFVIFLRVGSSYLIIHLNLM